MIEITADGVALVNGGVVGFVDRTGASHRGWKFTDLAGRERLANNRTALERCIIQAAEAAAAEKGKNEFA